MNIRSKTGDGVQVVVIAWFNSREWCKSAPLVYPTLEDAVDEWDKKVCDHHFMFTDFKGRKNIVLTKHLYDLTIEEYTRKVTLTFISIPKPSSTKTTTP